MRKCLARAPRWIALLLGALIIVDAADFFLVLAAETRSVAASHGVAPDSANGQTTRLGPRQIAAAHLFGINPAAARGEGRSTETELHLALSGVIATADPNDGYAILGESGQTTRLYRTGSALANTDSATLYQVFTDHVVLDFGGRQETLSLPRQVLNRSATVRLAALPRPAAEAAVALPISMRDEPPSAAEGWFSYLNAERYTADGRMGLRLHPAKHLQRRYGLRDGDTLMAVNGVPVADEDAVEKLLHAGGKTIALTVTRDGVEEELKFPVE